VREALETIGWPCVPITERVIDDPDRARDARMHGSPTILLDGHDPFAPPGTVTSVSCRLYRTASGLEGSPSVEELITAMSLDLPAHS
jgi:hypothetical protein